MAHESTFSISFGGVTLVSKGDLVESEPGSRRTPVQPNVSRPIGASAAKLYGGKGLSHSLSWVIRREFSTLALARTYQWTRPTELPLGGQTLTIVDSGITTTLINAHLVDFGLQHVPDCACTIMETVSVVGGAYSNAGSTVGIPTPATPSEPDELSTTGFDPATFLLLDQGGFLRLDWTGEPLRLDHN